MRNTAQCEREYANGTACGVKAGSGSYIEVGSVYTSGVGAIVEEATDSLASILITRKIVAYDDYIIVGGRLKDGSRESRTVPSIKAGYHTYNEGNNIVWVKIQTDVLAGPEVLPSSGGNSDITVSGVDQPVLVAAFDGDVAVVTGLTAESEGKQKAVLSFPENTSMTEAKKYTIMLSFDGGVEWFAQSLKITVMPKGAVCRIEAVPYSSLDDAFAAAIDGDTITLLNEIHLDSTLSIGWGGDTNLHLAGYNIIINSATGPGLNVDNRHIYLMGEGSIHVTGTTYGVYATNGGRISVTSAAATDPNGIAVYVYQAPGDFGGSVTVLGNVTSNGTGVKAYGVKSHITVNGNIEGKNYGIIAENGGKVTAEGDVVSQGDAVLAADEGSTITVGGNIVGVCAAKSYSGAEIKVEGNAEGLFGVFADGEESKVTVEGNVKATLEVDGIGAGVENGGAVEIGGSVESTRFGVMANGNHSYVFVKVGGSVTVSDRRPVSELPLIMHLRKAKEPR